MSVDEDVPDGARQAPVTTSRPGGGAGPGAARASHGTLIASVLAFAMTVVAIANVIVVPLLGELSAKLHASATAAAWSLIIVVLIGGVTTPVFGRLGDLFGYRKVLIVVFAGLTLGTVVCATASSMPVFLAGRVLQGFVGGVLPVAIGVVRNNVRAERARLAIGIIVAGEGVGVGVGFILGGLLQSYAWNVAFWVLLAPTAVSLALIIAFVPGAAAGRAMHKVDIPGAILLMAGVLALLLPLSEGGTWGWASAATLGLFAAGVVLMLAWGWWELHVTDPLIDLRPFANVHFLLPNLTGFAVGMSIGAVFLLFASPRPAMGDLHRLGRLRHRRGVLAHRHVLRCRRGRRPRPGRHGPGRELPRLRARLRDRQRGHHIPAVSPPHPAHAAVGGVRLHQRLHPVRPARPVRRRRIGHRGAARRPPSVALSLPGTRQPSCAPVIAAPLVRARMSRRRAQDRAATNVPGDVLMPRHHRKTLLGLGTLALAGALTATAIPALASSSSPSSSAVTGARIVAHFDLAAKQQPENITLEPDGDADVTFSYARQVARVTPRGKVTILATLPAAASGTTVVSGIVRVLGGTLYVNRFDIGGTGSGIWRISRDGTAKPVAALPGAKFLNGLALDPCTGALLATDSTLGVVWRVWPRTGKAEIWASGAALQPSTSSGLGANGLKVHDGSVWVSNSSKGTLLRIPVSPDGTAGSPFVIASGLPSIDDFAFISMGTGDTLLAVQNRLNKADLITRQGTVRTVLTAADGLSTPSAVAVRGRTVYVTSGAYFTGVDPNLLMAHLGR
jgi:MFS family permease